MTRIEIITLSFRYLTGNPCADHEGYRDYVVATLPQLQVSSCEENIRSDVLTNHSDWTATK